MKKFLALALAMMMVFACVSALAEDDNAQMYLNAADGGDAYLSHFSEENEYDEDGAASTGEVNTEIWLQVVASGQIDVTVPLVIVFQTNIDGGSATSPSEYQIINYSTADLVVTKVSIETNSATKDREDDDTSHPMELVSYTTDLARDQYKAQLSVATESVHASTGEWDLFTGDENDNVDLDEDGFYYISALEGGLIILPKCDYDSTSGDKEGTSTDLTIEMATGALSFVTKHATVEEKDVLDVTKGVKLLNINYVVAIDTYTGIGDDITAADQELPE